jgi:hypothetical protein
MTHFSGTTYDPTQDHDRLTTQLNRVFDKMRDGEWHTIDELGGELEYRLEVRPKGDITQDHLKHLLTYDAETGVFTWNKATGRAPAGAVAGWYDQDGYVQIRVCGKAYRAHRLAWLYVYGYLPTLDIDHVNGNPADNRISKLRETDRAGNLQNIFKPQSLKKNTTSRGVRQRGDGYSARIKVNGLVTNLGVFPTEKEAAKAYIEAKGQLQNVPTERVTEALVQLELKLEAA